MASCYILLLFCGYHWTWGWEGELCELRRRMVITLVIIGPADVWDGWGMKVGLFPGRWALPRYFYPFPIHHLHSFMMSLLLLLDSYASYADDYQPSIPDFFHVIWIYMICVTIANFTSFRFQPIPFSLPISVCIGSYDVEYHTYHFETVLDHFVAQRIPCTFGKFRTQVRFVITVRFQNSTNSLTGASPRHDGYSLRANASNLNDLLQSRISKNRRFIETNLFLQTIERCRQELSKEAEEKKRLSRR